jgi:hypothetical protein
LLGGTLADVGQKRGGTIVMVVMRAVVALSVGLVVLVAVGTFARPEPGPCDDPKGQGKHLLMLCSPLADMRLVLTSGAAATLLTWVGSGRLQRRLMHA